MNTNSIKNQEIKGKFVAREIYCNVNTMVEFILSQSYENSEVPFSWDDVENLWCYPEYNGVYANLQHGANEAEKDAEIERLQELVIVDNETEEEENRNRDIENEIEELENLETEQQEILEWWAISSYLYDQLKEKGYPVLDAGSCYVWGRTTPGQAILLDGVISEICSNMKIMEGQENEWK